MTMLLGCALLVWASPAGAQAKPTEAAPPFAAEVAALGDTDPAEVRRAKRALVRAGQRAVPALRRALLRGRKPVQIAVVKFVPEMGRVTLPLAPEILRFAQAAAGPGVELNDLVKTGPSGLRGKSLVALAALAPFLEVEIQDEFQSILADEMRDRHGFHLESYRRGYFRARARGTVENLVGLLEDENPYVREAAAERLSEQGDASPPVLAGLLVALRTEEHPSKVRIKLRAMSGSSGAQISKEIRLAAARALIRLARGGKDAAAAALFLVQEEPVGPRLLSAVRSVGQLGQKGKDALPRLLSLALGEDERLAAEAVTAVGMIGVFDADVEASLEKAAKRPAKSIAVRAAATLKMLRRGAAGKN